MNGTREILYPLCVYQSYYNAVSDKANVDKQGMINRKDACKKMVMAIEGFSDEEELANRFPDFYDALGDYDYVNMSETEYNQFIQKSFDYPIEYRITWLSALRSVFGLTYIPEVYRDIQQKMIYKTLSPLTYFGSDFVKLMGLGPGEVASFQNTDRINYAIELLAVDTYRQGKELDRTDPEISNNIPHLMDSWIAYTTYYENVVTEHKHLLDSYDPEGRELSFVGGMLSSLYSLFAEQYPWAWKKFWEPHTEWTTKKWTEKEVSLIKEFSGIANEPDPNACEGWFCLKEKTNQ